jgi:putative endonuclease
VSQARRQRGGAARRSGRRAEVWAALVLLLSGYRILGFRLRTRQGEIDLLALKGRVLAVVEVKSRLTAQAALEAVRPDQRQRLRRAGARLIQSRPSLKDCTLRLDLMVLSPGRWPRHIPDAWPGGY